MEERKLSEYQLALFHKWVTEDGDKYIKAGQKTMICHLTLVNGFEIVGTSACLNAEQFDEGIGAFYALVDAVNKLDERAGFYKQGLIHSHLTGLWYTPEKQPNLPGSSEDQVVEAEVTDTREPNTEED